MKESNHENVLIQPEIQVQFLTYQDSNLLVNNHWHNSLEILLIKSGKMNVWINDHLSQLQENDFIIINSKDIHSTKCLEPTIVQLLQIPYTLLKVSIPNLENIRFVPDNISDSGHRRETRILLHSLLTKMGEIYNTKETGYALRFTSLIYELLYILVKDCSEDISFTLKQKNTINHKRLTTIMEYVKTHYMDPISLGEAADLISLNPEYFCRFFKKNMGMTFLDYVNEIRLSHILQDIIGTDISITELLDTHGFHNYKLFLKMFHEKCGCTPLQLRKQKTNLQQYFPTTHLF